MNWYYTVLYRIITKLKLRYNAIVSPPLYVKQMLAHTSENASKIFAVELVKNNSPLW